MHEKETCLSRDGWDIEDNGWSEDVRDRVIVDTKHCRVIEHLARSGDYGAHKGFEGDWRSLTFVSHGKLEVRCDWISESHSQEFTPGEVMWDTEFDDMLEEAGSEENLNWQYSVHYTPTVWYCVYLRWPMIFRKGDHRTAHSRLYRPGDRIAVSADKPKDNLLLIGYEARARDMNGTIAPFTGSVKRWEPRMMHMQSGLMWLIFPSVEA